MTILALIGAKALYLLFLWLISAAAAAWLADRKVLCCGDLFIWASPNCGNPQKVQRYPNDWAAALRTMASLDAMTVS